MRLRSRNHQSLTDLGSRERSCRPGLRSEERVHAAVCFSCFGHESIGGLQHERAERVRTGTLRHGLDCLGDQPAQPLDGAVDAPSRPPRWADTATRPAGWACLPRAAGRLRRGGRRRPDRPRPGVRPARARGRGRFPLPAHRTWSRRRRASRSWPDDIPPAGTEGSLSHAWPATMPWGAPTARATVESSGTSRSGAAAPARASVSKARTISASPASTASGSPKARWTEGLPRRMAALSKQGRSSCTSEAQWSSSMAAAAASASSGALAAARLGDGETETGPHPGAAGKYREPDGPGEPRRSPGLRLGDRCGEGGFDPGLHRFPSLGAVSSRPPLSFFIANFS